MKTKIAILLILVSTNLFAQSTINQNGLQSTVISDINTTSLQAKQFEVASLIYNSHHWQNSSIVTVELFNVYHKSGYEKYTIELGYGQGTGATQSKLTLVDSKGIAHNARVTLGAPQNHSTSSSDGHPNKTIPIYVEVRYYSRYKVKISHLKNKVNTFTNKDQIIINESPSSVDIADFTAPVFSSSSSNLWTQNSNDIYFNQGNVGIGTPNPVDRLQIDGGSISIGPEGGTVMPNLSRESAQGGLLISRVNATDGSLNRNLMVIKGGGNVGIGTTNPSMKLQIAAAGAGHNNALALDTNEWFTFGNQSGYGFINWFSQANTTNDDFVNTHSSVKASSIKGGNGNIQFYTSSANTGIGQSSGLTEGMRIESNGNLLIGKTSQQNSLYKLDVNGSIRANEIKVNTTGADFVFEKNYNLIPLGNLEKFINENKHLPEIEPASEMQKNGVNIGELNTKLLQKIEELTLYTIQQQKEIETLKKEKRQLNSVNLQLLELQKRVKKLEE